MNHQSQQKVLFVQTFIVFHNMMQTTWPSSGNTTVCGICGRKSKTLSIIKRNEISFFT